MANIVWVMVDASKELDYPIEIINHDQSVYIEKREIGYGQYGPNNFFNGHTNLTDSW